MSKRSNRMEPITTFALQARSIGLLSSNFYMNTVSHLECSVCGKLREAGIVHNLCECGGPLLVRYDLEKTKATWRREAVASGPPTLWRYAPVLPVRDASSIVSLGEGMTPLLQTARIGAQLGARNLWVKDEGLNPTGSFKARGLSCAVSMCVELGIRKVAIPSAGNAASAMAAYAAAAGIEAHIFMPRDVPQSNYFECKAFGAHVTLVDGLISDCGRIVAARKDAEGALPHQRQEDHGIRSSRAARLATSRRHLLSGGWRRRSHWHVESLRGN